MPNPFGDFTDFIDILGLPLNWDEPAIFSEPIPADNALVSSRPIPDETQVSDYPSSAILPIPRKLEGG